jgi:hypothetical protein
LLVAIHCGFAAGSAQEALTEFVQEKDMKALALLLLLINVALAGCVAYPAGPRGDRDGDGVPNVQDRRPNDPYRY